MRRNAEGVDGLFFVAFIHRMHSHNQTAARATSTRYKRNLKYALPSFLLRSPVTSFIILLSLPLHADAVNRIMFKVTHTIVNATWSIATDTQLHPIKQVNVITRMVTVHLFSLVSKARKKPKAMPYIILSIIWDTRGTVCEERVSQHYHRNNAKSNAKKIIMSHAAGNE